MVNMLTVNNVRNCRRPVTRDSGCPPQFCSPARATPSGHSPPRPAPACCISARPGHALRATFNPRLHLHALLCYWSMPSGLSPSPHSPSPLQYCLPARFVRAVCTRSNHVTLTSEKGSYFRGDAKFVVACPTARQLKQFFVNF